MPPGTLLGSCEPLSTPRAHPSSGAPTHLPLGAHTSFPNPTLPPSLSPYWLPLQCLWAGGGPPD